MSETTRHPEHIPHDSSKSGETRPYWKRAHHDWRFWIAMVLMAAAISTYVLTQDLRIRPQNARVMPGPNVPSIP
jgi:hypothetical protein